MVPRGGKITVGKLLDICRIDRESVNLLFLSSTSMEILPTSFAGLWKNSFGFGGLLLLVRLRLDLQLSM